MDSLCQECAPQEIYKALIIGRLRVRMHAVCKTLIRRFDPDSRLQLSSPGPIPSDLQVSSRQLLRMTRGTSASMSRMDATAIGYLTQRSACCLFRY
jgi:hypothetical protein